MQAKLLRALQGRTIERLRALLVTRRRDKRRELLRDVSEMRDLPRSAMESFMAKLLEEAREDLEVTPAAGVQPLDDDGS